MGGGGSVVVLGLLVLMVCPSGGQQTDLPDVTQPQVDPPMPAPMPPGGNTGSLLQHTVVGASQGRPANMFYPAACAKGASTAATPSACPLVMVLHAFGSNGSYHAQYLRVLEHAQEFGFGALLPDGTLNSNGYRFWNGPECCNTEDADVDDLGYLTHLLEEAQEKMETNGIYLIGHSNGGNMASALACNTSLVNGMFSIAGFNLPEDCQPAHAISVTLVHGTIDNIVLFETSEQALAGWLAVNHCPNNSVPVARASRDYDCDTTRPVGLPGYIDEWRDTNCELPGNETQLTEYGPCSEDSKVAFWRLEGAGHVPSFNDLFAHDMLSSLLHDYVEKGPASTGRDGGPVRRGRKNLRW